MKNIVCSLLLLVSLQSFSQLKYSNPILSGFYPDPSICRVGDDYYIVNSSFAYFPGLPVFHSKDLVNWELLGHAMDRKEQLNLNGAGVSRGLFAPTIRYHNGVYYIICTLIDKGGNFVITATEPKGPWSNPVWLPQVNGIDPSLYFDDTGKAYVLFNSIPPDNISLHDGHRTIRMFEFDITNLKTTGDEKLLVNGGTDMAKKPVWIEGPHIFKKDGWYYLICAEGGTGYNHSEVVFRSKQVDGPYISFEKNPILTQRHLDPKRKNPVTTTGHADFVEGPDGKWWAVFLGCRPYEDDFYNTGRETFLTPVEWKEGWPIINPGYEEVQYNYPVPSRDLTVKVINPFNGNVEYRNDFNKTVLDPRFIFLRNPNEGMYSLSARKGYLTLPLQSQTIEDKESPSFIGFRQSNLEVAVTTSLDFKPAGENEKAGLMIFQNEKNYYYICKSLLDGKPVVQLYRSGQDGKTPELLASQPLRNTKSLRLMIGMEKNYYFFYFSENNKDWTILHSKLDASYLSTKSAGGFVGALFALYVTSGGKPTFSKAYYNWFEYKGDDAVYR